MGEIMITYKGRKLRPWADLTLRLIACILVISICAYMGKQYRISLAEEYFKKHGIPELPESRLKTIDDLPKIDKNDAETLYFEPTEALTEDKEYNDNLLYLGSFKLTSYCDCYECQEEWVGTTALGVSPQENWTIAVDPSIIPLGSYVWINGNQYRAEDVGGAIKNNHIDIFVGSHEESYSSAYNGYADVYMEVIN